MTSGQVSAAVARGRGVEARVEELRHALATTTDPTARSRLRVRLVDLLSVLGDAPAAAGELKQAAAEGPPSAGMLFGLRVVLRRLPAAETDALTAAIRTRRPVRPQQTSPGAASKRKARAGRDGAGVAGGGVPLVQPSAVERPLATPPAAASPLLAPVPAASRESPVRDEPLEQAVAALAEGKPIRARRLGEEAARRGAHGAPHLAQIGKLVVALEQAGAKRESLRLERTLAERSGDGGTAPTGATEAIEALIHRATQIGEPDLAARWSTDLDRPWAGAAVERRVPPSGATRSVSSRFQEAQRLAMVATLDGQGFESAIAGLVPLLGGHPGASDALSLVERLADLERGRPPAFRVEMLRAAFEAERAPRRRRALAGRWARALDEKGDIAGALAALGRAIEELPQDSSSELRRFRADLLRAEGREADLCRALEGDAQVEKGVARQALLVEQARLLDRMGDFDAALDVRLRALKDSPGDLGLLVPARQRLESMGRLDRSLDLAIAALSQVTERSSRASLLRDVATLAEATAGDRARAYQAWHEVLSLVPTDPVALDSAERLLRQLGDADRLGGLLSSWAAREVEPTARGKILWRLAEFRRVERQAPFAALPLYREIVAGGAGNAAALSFADEDWQRRDDLLAVHTARALAAPNETDCARALADRAELLTAADRWQDADRDLDRALDLDPTVDEIFGGQERLHQRHGDLRTLRQRLTTRVEMATGAAAAHIWFGIGHTSEAMGELPAAVMAYERATLMDATFRAPMSALRQLALARGDFPQAIRLLQNELSVCAATAERVGLSVQLAVLLTTKANAASRAVEILDAALALEPSNPTVLDAMFAAALAAGSWEKAVHALEAMLAAGLATADTSERYHRLGTAAERTGQVDRALGFYSRSYARNPAFRPTLERLSEICFERQQWENAWKATEHLLERHGADLSLDTRADLTLRSALSDLHVAQRLVAASRITAMLVGPVSPTGLRDLADSWASMRFEPQLLAGIDGDRRSRVMSRLSEVLALTDRNPGHAARLLARETLAALAVAERRWAEAVAALDTFGDDPGLDANRRCLFLVSAGDILLNQQGDVAGAALRYQRARGLNPREPRLTRAGIIQVMGGPGGRRLADEDQATPGPIRRA